MTALRTAALFSTLVLAGSACSAGETTPSQTGRSALAPGSEAKSGAPGNEARTEKAPARRATTVAARPLRFSKKKGMHHVRSLAKDIGVRTKTSRNERRAARYFRDRMRAFGYEVTVQKFRVNGGTSRNVVARWPGSKRYPLVVGAHIDTVPRSPGANDNASGTAVVLELARIFAGTGQAEWVTFVAFGSEEYDSSRRSHHDGSAHYVKKLGRRGRQRTPGMISVDMVADGRPLLVGNSGISGRHRVANSLHNTIRKRNIAVRRITLCDCSDHGPFEHAGIDAAFAYSGNEPDYHSPSDTPANLKPDHLLRTGRALRGYLRKLDEQFIAWLRSS